MANRVRLLIVAGLGAVAIGALIWSPQVNHWSLRLLEIVQSAGYWAPLLFIAVYILACLLFLPGSLLTIGAGFIFGFVEGVVIVSIGSTLGAGAAFLFARTLMRDFVARKVAHLPRFAVLQQAVKREGFKIVLLTRLSPLFPFNLLNFAFGLTTVSFRDYLLASWMGMLPGAVLFIYIGSMIRSLSDLSSGKSAANPAQTFLLVFGLVATVLVTVLLARIARKALSQST
jgi:uncharacterized membrane protein YdjX (TVP38/TMEM64 family)